MVLNYGGGNIDISSRNNKIMKNHYVYYSYEEFGRDYIGCKICNCFPEDDASYLGSS
jgi:hypothetical protein